MPPPAAGAPSAWWGDGAGGWGGPPAAGGPTPPVDLRAATLVSFNVAAVTGGIDALGDVTVQVDVGDDQRFTGRGVSTDIVEASARAFVNALNKSVRLRRGARPAPVQTP